MTAVKNFGHSGNVIENKGTYWHSPVILLKINDLFQCPDHAPETVSTTARAFRSNRSRPVRCIAKALELGVRPALEDLPGVGRPEQRRDLSLNRQGGWRMILRRNEKGGF